LARLRENGHRGDLGKEARTQATCLVTRKLRSFLPGLGAFVMSCRMTRNLISPPTATFVEPIGS